MSNTPDTNEAVEVLLKEGIAAARLGDRETARARLHDVIEIDRNNEKAWFWLAAVVETIAERRQCLESVLLINPNNQRAQVLLDQIDQATHLVDVKVASGNRSAMMVIAIGAAVLIGAIFFAILSVLGGGGDDNTSSGDGATQVAGAPVEVEATNTPAGPPTETSTPTATLLPTNTVTTAPTLPPAFSPTPTAMSTATSTPVALDPPADVTGQLFVISGDDFLRREPEFQQIFVVPVGDASQRTQLFATDVRARLMNASPNLERFVTEQYNSGQNLITLQVVNFNGTNSVSLSRYWNQPLLSEQRMPRWSPVADEVVFIARTGFDRQNNIYVVDVSGPLDPGPTPVYDPDDPESTPPPPPPITQLTDTEEVDETWPAWSPDGTRVVYVADTSLQGTDNVDLWMIDVATKDVYAVTSDGIAVRESMPNWGGPNGDLVVFSAQNPDGTSDIWIVDIASVYLLEEGPREPEPVATEVPTEVVPTEEAPVDPAATEQATEEPTPIVTVVPTEEPTPLPTEEPAEVVVISGQFLVDIGPQDIMPIWSPDGRYIVFSANSAINERDFDVYVYNYETGEVFVVFQLPDSREVAFDWFE